MAKVCLITGCALKGPHGTSWGDLHMVGDCFVFTAFRGDDGETNWNMMTFQKFDNKGKIITLRDGCDYFERHGVIVFEALHAIFNPAAREYLKDYLNGTPT